MAETQLVLSYVNPRGAHIQRYWSIRLATARQAEIEIKTAMKGLARRKIEATLIVQDTKEKIGSVEEDPDPLRRGWVWWYDNDPFNVSAG